MFQNSIHCTEVIERDTSNNDSLIILDQNAESIIVKDTKNVVVDLWTNTFWSTSGTYQVTYSLDSIVQPVVTFLIVDTLELFSIDTDGFLVIDAPDFDNASLVRYRLDRQAKTSDNFPTKFKVNGNPHYTNNVPVFKNFVVEEVIFGDGVTHLGSYTFKDDLVADLELPNTLEFVGSNTIVDCTKLERLTFFETNRSKDNSLVDLPANFCIDNDVLRTIDLSLMTSLTGITGKWCFYGNVNLETVILPPTVVTLGYWTFAVHEDDWENAKLYDVNLGNVKHFGEDTFVHCDKMRNFDMRSMESAHKYSLWTVLINPPQVVTLQNTDQLIMLVTSEDVLSNQFTARTFQFITDYTEEDLAPFSDLYSNWTLVPSLASSPIVSASSGGDPYVFPLVGPVYKLPNCEEVYRLYQDDHVVINAMVSVASPEIQAEIVRAVADSYEIIDSRYKPVAAEAYFYSHVFVASRTTDDKVNIDIEQKQHLVTGTTNMFRVEPQQVSKNSRSYDIPVRWGQDTCLTISYSRNSQVRNSLRLSGRETSLASGTGLLMRNYRPKLFRLPNLHSISTVSIPKRCVRPLTKRGTRGQNEVLIRFQVLGTSSTET